MNSCYYWQIFLVVAFLVSHVYSVDEVGDDSAAISQVPSSLVGTWRNELESVMLIYPFGPSKHQFNGLYCSKVGLAMSYYPLVGQYDPDGDATEGTLGWTVQWINKAFGNSKSTTTWSGQRYIIDGNPTIYTTWLLTSEQVFGKNWKSTLIGKDEFTNISNSPEEELCGLHVGTKKTEL